MCHLFLVISSQVKSTTLFSRSFMRYGKVAQILALYETPTRFFTDRVDVMLFEPAAFHACIHQWKSCFTLTWTVTWKSWKYSAYWESIEHLTSRTSCRGRERRLWPNQSVWLVLQIIKRASKFENFVMKFWCSWGVSGCLISLSNFLLSCTMLSAVYEEKVASQDHSELFNTAKYACRSDDSFSKSISLKNHNVGRFQSDWFWLIWWIRIEVCTVFCFSLWNSSL